MRADKPCPTSWCAAGGRRGGNMADSAVRNGRIRWQLVVVGGGGDRGGRGSFGPPAEVDCCTSRSYKSVATRGEGLKKNLKTEIGRRLVPSIVGSRRRPEMHHFYRNAERATAHTAVPEAKQGRRRHRRLRLRLPLIDFHAVEC